MDKICGSLSDPISYALQLVILTLLISGCSRQDGHENLFRNGSFEKGKLPWFSFVHPDKPYWLDFEVSTEHAHSGSSAAKLVLRSKGYTGKARIAGLIQEFTNIQHIPHRLSGWYRLENWHRGVPNQYLQVVAMTFGGDERPNGLKSGVPVQIAYVLGGITKAPFKIRNRRFQFQGNENPLEGQWIPFEVNLAADFRTLWGIAPKNIDMLRVLFEVRYDGADPQQDQVTADVYFDDLYLGH